MVLFVWQRRRPITFFQIVANNALEWTVVMVRLLLHGGGIRQAGVKIKPAKSALQKQLPPVASRATVHLQQDSFDWCVLEVGVEGDDAVL